MTLEEKIDKIAEDSSYMRGKFDVIIPQLQKTCDEHEKRIQTQENLSSNMAGKASVIGAVVGSVAGFVLSILSTKIRF